MRRLFAMLALLAVVGCASVPKIAPVDETRTPVSMVVILQCDEFKGAVATTKDGKLHSTQNAQVVADTAKVLPDGSLGVVNLTSDCRPKLKT